jgi:hypothetical protein
MTATGGLLRLLCRKTELCRFYQRGACKRGAACDFAHEEQDVRTKPDLQRTKPCPALVNGQRCENPSCAFAHDTGKLRRLKPARHASGAHAAAEGTKSGVAFRAENLSVSGNCSTLGSNSSSRRSDCEASSDASADVAGSFDLDLDGCNGGLKLGLGAMDPDAGSAGTSSCASAGLRAASVWSRQTTVCGSDDGFDRQTSGGSDDGLDRQTSGGSDDGFSRQTSGQSEGDRRPVHRSERKRYKTRMCNFYVMGKCRRDECTFAHGVHELTVRGGGCEESSVPPPPRLWPQPASLHSESTECAPESPGRPTSDDDLSWAPPSEPCRSCADEGEEEDEEECRLVVVKTFLTIPERRPKEFRRSSSTPPGR